MRGAWGPCSARATRNGCDRWSVPRQTTARLVPPPDGDATRVCIFPDDIRLTCRRTRAGGSVVEPRGVRRVQRDIPCAVVQHTAHAHGASKPRRSSRSIRAVRNGALRFRSGRRSITFCPFYAHPRVRDVKGYPTSHRSHQSTHGRRRYARLNILSHVGHARGGHIQHERYGMGATGRA